MEKTFDKFKEKVIFIMKQYETEQFSFDEYSFAALEFNLQRMQKRSFIMTRTLIIESGQKPTEEQLKEVEEAKKSPINFDEHCGELSPAMMKAFKSAVVQRNRKKKA